MTAAAAPAGAYLAEIARLGGASEMPRMKREKLIAEAVRDAVRRATADTRNPAAMVKAAVEVTTAAAEAAPQFADAIARAAVFSGPWAKIEGAQARIRAAAFSGAAGASHNPGAHQSGAIAVTAVAPAPDGPGAMRITRTSAAEIEGTEATPPTDGARVRLGRNSSVSLTGVVSVSRDSNIFLQDTNEVAETITSLRPGVDFRFGQRSQASGRLGYQMAFNQYANHAGPNSRLGAANAEFSYANARTSLDLGATHQQVEQGTRDIAALAGNSLLRRTVGMVEAGGETALTAKTRLATGVTVDWTKYKRAGLVGGSNLTVPLRVHLALRPKVDVSLGYSYDRYNPQGAGESAQGGYYNLGFRGALSEKLGANFSAGYRSRDFAGGESEGLWGFDGSFDYRWTAKTSLALAVTRGFGASAAGESTTSTGFSLSLTSNPTLHWQLAARLGYQDIDYGPRVFVGAPVVAAGGRSDQFWDLNFTATYVINSWMNLSAAWTLRRNASSQAGAGFTSNVVSLMLGFRY